MQKKATDFSRLKVILDSTLDQLKALKDDDTDDVLRLNQLWKV